MALGRSSSLRIPLSSTTPTQGTYGSGYCPPPPCAVSDNGGQPVQNNWKIPTISEGEAQEAFLEYVSNKCCYSRSPARKMIFEDLQSFNTYRYRLETFTESRYFEWKTKPFTGKITVPVMNVSPLLPWNVPVTIPTMFKTNTQEIMIPNTSSVKDCSMCVSSGKTVCKGCGGHCTEKCNWCKGKGIQFIDDICTHCSGSGLSTTMCRICSGRGRINCETCRGHGRILTYYALVVKWENNIFEHVAHQRNDFPAKLFKEVTGQKLFVDEQDKVYPITNFPDVSINKSSRNAIEQHRSQFMATSWIRRQRQTVEQILLARVEYGWHNKSHSFYVYGNEHKVYAEDYPQKCCCIIL